MANNLGGYTYYQGDWTATLAWYARCEAACRRTGHVTDAALARRASLAMYLDGPNAPRIRRGDVPHKPGALRPKPLTLMVDRTQIARSVVNSTTRHHDG